MERRPERNISEDWTFYSINTSKEYPDPQCNITYVVFYLHKPSVAAVFIVSYLLIFLVCMVGNGVVCFTIVRSKNMRTVTNVFILNLAVSDLLVGIFCMPTTLLDNIITGWPFGSLVCKMSGMVQGISVSASVFTLVAIAVDRFWCIVYPFKQKLTLSTSILIIVIIWVLAVSIMCPSGVMLQVTEEKNIRILLGDNETIPFYWCRENWPTQEMRKIYTTILFANIYLAPLTLIVIMYARIGITLFKSSMLTGKKPGQDNRHTVSRKKKRVLKMLLIVALLFIVSWSPLWALMMLSDYASLTDYQHKLINIYIYPFAHWLAFFNSSINPIIYGFFNENFQRGFQAAFSKFHLCSAEVTRGQTYAHRIQGNVVRPANLQTSNGTNPVHSRANSHSMRSHALNEQDLIMEDL